MHACIQYMLKVVYINIPGTSTVSKPSMIPFSTLSFVPINKSYSQKVCIFVCICIDNSLCVSVEGLNIHFGSPIGGEL